MDEKKTFVIECYTSNYDQKDQGIRKCHSKLFKSDKYLFHPIDDLIKLMSFEFINNLKPDHFTALPSKWLKNVNIILRKAEVNSIALMKLYRLLRANECGKLLNESMERIIYEVKLVNGSNRIVTFADIFDLVGDEKSTQGDINCLSDLASGRWLEFGWGAKNKDSALSENVSPSIFLIGEDVIVLNHGIHWQNCGRIVDIDLENDTTMIKWETTKKSESVSIEDLQKISIDNKSLRKRKPMDFFLPQPDTKIPSMFQSDEYMLMEEEIQNKNYLSTNSSELCAEGAIVNLMNVMNCSDDDMKLFWSIVCDQSMQSVCEKLQVMSVPKIVHKTKKSLDSLQEIHVSHNNKNEGEFISKFAEYNELSFVCEVPCDYFSQSNTCLLSSCYCCVKRYHN